MARKGLLAVLVFLVAISSAYAISPLVIDSEPVKTDIQPSESALFKITLINNQNNRDTFALTAPLSTWDISFSDYIVDVPAQSSEEVTVRLSPPMQIRDGKYAVFLKAHSTNDPSIKNHEYVHVSVKSPEVIEETEDIREISVTEESSEGLFGKSYSFNITNSGNVLYSDTWEQIVSSFDLSILRSNLDYEAKEYGDDHKISWSIDLEPKETMTITYSISYFPVFLGGILLLLASFLFITNYLNKFSVTKELKKGADSILVSVSIKNRTNTEMKNVKLEDMVPKPLKLVKDFGTVAPSSIVNAKNGTKIVWKFDVLAPKEELIINYQVKSSMHVLGNIQLPQARLTQDKNTTYSGNVKIIGK